MPPLKFEIFSCIYIDLGLKFLFTLDYFFTSARLFREPRKVLAEFGLRIEPHVKVVVHDSTADCR